MSSTVISEDFLSLSKAGVAENLKSIELCVERHLYSEVKLKGDYIWEVKDTVFKGDSEILEDCEECYLPDHMKMQVLGEVRHISWNSPLLLMMCEDGQIYAYDDQQLHLVAESLRHLFNEGITFPSKTVYHYGQAFEDMTEKELKEVRKSDEMAKAKEIHRSIAEKWGGENCESIQRSTRTLCGSTKRDGRTSNWDTEKKRMTEQH